MFLLCFFRMKKYSVCLILSAFMLSVQCNDISPNETSKHVQEVQDESEDSGSEVIGEEQAPENEQFHNSGDEHINSTSQNVTSQIQNKPEVKPPKRVTCLPRAMVKNEAILMNGSYFLQFLTDQSNPNITNRSQAADCTLGFFYAAWCPFSARAAPHFNGLARLFPNINMLAVDTGKYHGINTQFGIIGLPTLILFHNSKPTIRYNLTEYRLANFSSFLTLHTELIPVGLINVLEEDHLGPVPTKEVPEPDYYLYLAWIFTIICGLVYFGKSSFCQRIINSVRNAWQEAEIQHEHGD